MRLFSSLRMLMASMSNTALTTYQLCRLLQVPVTRTYIQQQLEAHPDYPSLLAVSDVLQDLKINNLSIQTDAGQLQQLPTPLVAQLQGQSDPQFVVVTGFDNDAVHYYHPEYNRSVTVAKGKFDKEFTGVVLLAEASALSGEKDHQQHARKERQQLLLKILPACCLISMVLLTCFIAFISKGLNALPNILYTLLSLAGAAVAGLLLWYKADQSNPVFRQLCAIGKADCQAVFHSAGASIFGIPWSVIGCAYFAGTICCLVITGINHGPVMPLLGWLSALALLYSVYSIYYQAKIAKQWCPLCLTIQAILVLQFVMALWGGYLSVSPFTDLTMSALIAVLFSFLLVVAFVNAWLPAVQKAKQGKINSLELSGIKHDPDVMHALLTRQRTLTTLPKELGITIGNPAAKYTLLKICNPYCAPCAKSHAVVEELLDNNPDVCMQIIFTAPPDDYRSLPVRHFLAIDEKGDPQQTKEALSDWYHAKKVDYDQFAINYPMNGELNRQNDKVKWMHTWCQKEKISFTPTFFIATHGENADEGMLRYYQLPDQYTVQDLKYFFSDHNG